MGVGGGGGGALVWRGCARVCIGVGVGGYVGMCVGVGHVCVGVCSIYRRTCIPLIN